MVDAFRLFAEHFDASTAEIGMQKAVHELLKSHNINTPPTALKPIWNTFTSSPIRYRSDKSPFNTTLEKTPYQQYIIDYTLASKGENDVGDDSHQPIHEVSFSKIDQYDWRRQRFSIAHEIGHMIIEDVIGETKVESLLKSLRTYSRLERLCDLAATELLMPTKSFTSELKQNGLSTEGLRKLYDTFLVSSTSMLFRITEIIPPSAIFFWKTYRRHEQEESTLRLKRCYPIDKTKYIPALPEHCTLKNIFPDIVSRSIEVNKTICSDEIILKTGRNRNTIYSGIACQMFSPRPVTTEQKHFPLFEGFEVPDESSRGLPDAILLLINREVATQSSLWQSLCNQAVPYL